MKIIAFLRVMRPKQWTKNIFVFAGLLFDKSSTNSAILLDVGATFVCFCLAASAVYIINDIFDRDADRQHTYKRRRPIASGEISPSTAGVFAALLLIGAISLSFFVSMTVAAIVATYVVMNTAYSAGLKRIVILDVFIISAGFLLRILAGTVGVGMAPSEWLFLCSLCLTLFLGFGKRRAELGENYAGHGENSDRRSVLQEYSAQTLDSMMSAVAACTFLSYGLFAMSESTVAQHGTSGLVYTLPFVMYAMFRYFHMVHGRGKGSDPSEDLVTDPHILISGGLWLLTTFALIR